jgi:hypothetical protein
MRLGNITPRTFKTFALCYQSVTCVFLLFLSARKADLKKGFQHLVVVVVVVVLVVGTRVKKRF